MPLPLNSRWILAVSVLAACAEPPAPESPRPDDIACTPLGTTRGRSLRVASLTPSRVSGNGGEVMTLTTTNGCRARSLSLSVDGQRIDQFVSPAPDVFQFLAPRLAKAFDERTAVVIVSCSEPPDASFTYCFELGTNVVRTSLGVAADPSQENEAEATDRPFIKLYAPVVRGSTEARVSVLSRMIVIFSRGIEKLSVNPGTFGIKGVSGSYRFAEGDEVSGYKEVTFTPSRPLAYDTDETCVVTTGVKGKNGKSLLPGGTPDATADRDSWTFHTRSIDEPPFVVEFAAGAGHASGGGYRNFGIIAPLAPVGESRATQYGLEAGRIRAFARHSAALGQ